MTASSVQEPGVPSLECPPSLRRLAPATATIQQAKRGQPRLSSGGMFLVAHRKYQVRVIYSAGLPDEQIGSASLAPDEHLRPIGSAQWHALGDGRREYVLSFMTSRLFRPFPVQTRVSVVLNHNRWGTFCHELPVIIWPSMLNTLFWAFSVVAAAVWPGYLAQASVLDGHLRPFPQILEKLRASQELLLITGAGTVGVGFLVYLANWGYQLFVASDSCQE